MNFALLDVPLHQAEVDLLVVPVTEMAVANEGASIWLELEEKLGLDLREEMREERFHGELGQALALRRPAGMHARWLVFMGAGTANQLNHGNLRRVGAQAARKAKHHFASSLAICLPLQLGPLSEEVALRQIFEGLDYGDYEFDRYRADSKDDYRGIDTAYFLSQDEDIHDPQATLEQAASRAAGTRFARDLVNEPPQVLHPPEMAARASQLAEDFELDKTIFDHQALLEGGFNLIDAVGRGSENKPHLIHLVYRPEGEIHHRIALVGKGVTFDTGGYSIKPASSMVGMHCDMAGGAAVLGTARAIGELRPPHVEIHFVVPTAENSISGDAMRPQDIVRGYGGKTVEILNTDAEGRLILADALAYIQRNAEVDQIIDLATLTGACVVALGEFTAALFTNDNQIADGLLDASLDAQEDFWRMPLTERLDEFLDTPFADVKNVGPRWGGAITAALFLKRFVEIDAWCHLDIAGPAFAEKDDDYFVKGGTGFAVATLTEYILRLAD